MASNGIDNDVGMLKKIIKLQKNLEKLQFILCILQNSKEQIGNIISDLHIKNAVILVKNLEKVQYLLKNIDNISNILMLLKYGSTENYLVDTINKINKEFQNKKYQIIDACKHLTDVPRNTL